MNAMRLQRRRLLATSIGYLFVEPVLCADGSAGGAEFAARSLPFPVSAESVLDRGSIEGHPVAITRFHAALPAAEALARVVRAWRSAGEAQVLVRSNAGWRIVSARDAHGYRTLQLRDAAAGGCEGLLSVWARSAQTTPAPARGRDPLRLLPADARVLRRLEGIDAGRRHRTVIAVSPSSAGWTMQALDSRLTGQGFHREQLAAVDPAAAGEARLYRAESAELGVTVHPYRGRAAIVIHLTEADR